MRIEDYSGKITVKVLNLLLLPEEEIEFENAFEAVTLALDKIETKWVKMYIKPNKSGARQGILSIYKDPESQSYIISPKWETTYICEQSKDNIYDIITKLILSL